MRVNFKHFLGIFELLKFFALCGIINCANVAISALKKYNFHTNKSSVLKIFLFLIKKMN